MYRLGLNQSFCSFVSCLKSSGSTYPESPSFPLAHSDIKSSSASSPTSKFLIPSYVSRLEPSAVAAKVNHAPAAVRRVAIPAQNATEVGMSGRVTPQARCRDRSVLTRDEGP